MRKIALVLLVLIVMLSMAPEAFAWSKHRLSASQLSTTVVYAWGLNSTLY